VSNLGRIRKIVKQQNWNGYRSVSINRQNVLVHRLVCAAFCGNPANLLVNHKNAIKHDNRAENLEPITPSGNVLHAVLLGIGAIGENNGQTKITPEIVEQIRASPIPHKKIGDRVGLSKSQVSRIRRGQSWKQIAGGYKGNFVPSVECGENFRLAELFTFNGKTQTLTKWAQELKINRATLASRLYGHKWPVSQAFTRSASRTTNCKLTKEQIIEIAHGKETQRIIAERYGIGQTQVSRIRNGKRWASITGLG